MADRPDQHRLGATPAHPRTARSAGLPWGLRSFEPSSRFNTAPLTARGRGRKHDDYGHAQSILVDNVNRHYLSGIDATEAPKFEALLKRDLSHGAERPLRYPSLLRSIVLPSLRS